MTTTSLLPLFMLAGLFGATPSDSGEKHLQGTWIVESIEHDGLQLVASDADDSFLVKKCIIRGDRLTVVMGSKKNIHFKVSVSKQGTPKWIDLVYQNGSAFRGIFAVDGDVLLVAISTTPKAPRPKSFNSTDGEFMSVYTLRHAKRQP